MKRDDEEPYGDYPRVERIIERRNGYSHLKDVVFTALIIAAGGVIWSQQAAINTIEKDIVALKLKCEAQPLMRGVPHKEVPLYPQAAEQ